MASSYDGRVRPARAADATGMANVYAAAMPGDVAARLGRRYLATVMFPDLIASSAGSIVVADGNAGIEGFCVLATDSRAMNAVVKSKPLRTACAVGLATLRDPLLMRDLLASLFAVRRKLDRDIEIERCAEIYLIAVSPAAQGRGVGGAVIEAALAGLSTGCVAKTMNRSAVNFYAQHAFKPVGREWRGRRELEILYRER